MIDVQSLKVLVSRLDQVSDLDEIVMGLSGAKALRASYGEVGIPVPDWIKDACEVLDREVRRRTDDELKRQEKELVKELDALKSREEKRAEKEQKLAALRERLNSKV